MLCFKLHHMSSDVTDDQAMKLEAFGAEYLDSVLTSNVVFERSCQITMPSSILARKLYITAADEGLLLHPVGHKSHDVKIEYGRNRISSAVRDEKASGGLEVAGLAGILDLVESSYLIAITKKEQVAKIKGSDVWRVTDVVTIPLHAGREEAEGVLAPLVKGQKNGGSEEEEEDGESSEEEGDFASLDKHEPDDEVAAIEETDKEPAGGKKGVLGKSTSFVKNVVQERGKYGRFATRWFSRNGSREGVRRQEGMAVGEEKEETLTKEQTRQMDEALPEDETASGDDETQEKATEQQQSAIEHLTPRILRNARLYFSNGGFYFSYEHDISGSLAQRSHTGSSIPLWKRFDELFFWNRHLIKPFIDSGLDSLVLPLMQGFVGQRAFSIARTEGTENDVVADAAQDPEEVVKAQSEDKPNTTQDEKGEPSTQDFLLTLVSRRSIRRAGLRYLRRGIDDDGSVANSVETEQILSSQDWNDSRKSFGLLQIRGSIPLFFSQSPYSFKPVPVMFGSEATNQTSFRKHFKKVALRYGKVQCASLVDQHGTEVGIGEAYEKHAKKLNEEGGIDGKDVGFEWFDFHGACKGMRFENVQLLMDKLQGQLNSFGWVVKQNDMNMRQQTGVLRTNCMDCLDRTNVVQSAVAGWALQQQLAELGLKIDLKSDPKTQWFNTLWADNGDAISKQYAGTAALKGDFTRTRKRNWTGALSDFSLTLNRYYNNIFGDYFLQTNIDYFLGNASPAIFDDFETDMMSQDYALDMRQVRQSAIDTCVNIVLEDPAEILKAGWTLSSPGQSNTLRALPFEECVLLLTDRALYFCRFNWETEKIGSFERVELLDIKAMWRGVYITNALGGTHLDEKRNVGFVVKYDVTQGQGLVRTNTRSMSVAEGSEANQEATKPEEQHKPEEKILAFKALPPRAVAAKDDDQDLIRSMSEQELVKHICDEIHDAMEKAWRRDVGFQHIETDKPPQVEEKDVISVTEAKRSTGYLESLGYGLKRLVWS